MENLRFIEDRADFYAADMLNSKHAGCNETFKILDFERVPQKSG